MTSNEYKDYRDKTVYRINREFYGLIRIIINDENFESYIVHVAVE